MKRKKNSKKVHKNKLFRKRAYKTYKRGHSIHRIRRSHIGGEIDWGKAQSIVPGSPQKKVTPTKSLSESLKRLLSEKGESSRSPSVPYVHKSEKTLSQIEPKQFSPKKDSNLYTPMSSISHEQEHQVPIKQMVLNAQILDRGAIVQSYNLSPNSSPADPSQYNPPKNMFVDTQTTFHTTVPGYPQSLIDIPVYTIQAQPSPSPPQPLTVKTGDSYTDITAQERSKMIQFNLFNQIYYTLAPRLYYIMVRLNLESLFGTALVWGDLNDELIECIGLSSEKAIESRLLYRNTQHIRVFIEKCRIFYTNLGASVSDRYRQKPYEYHLVTAPPPLQNADPQSYRVLGYNTHPFFHPPPITDAMYEEGMKNQMKKSNEYVYLQAHGGIGEELSSHKKILAKKYIRLIEFGNAFEMVAAQYKPFFKKINELMRQPDYHILFENTTRGEQMRKSVYSQMCKYFVVGSIDACSVKDSLTLVDITHEREFEGHFPDNETIDDHKVTFRSMEGFKSMGLFVPVDYNEDKSDKFLYKKELFKLYPGSNFFTTSTKIKLVDTLIPIAVNENKIFNVLVFSCAVRYLDEPPSPPPFQPPIPGVPQPPIAPPPLLPGMPPPKERILQRKSGYTQPHFAALLHGKKYISDLLRFVTNLEVASLDAIAYVTVRDLYDSNASEMKTADMMTELDKDRMIRFLEKIGKYYTTKKTFFISYPLHMMASLFSFNEKYQTASPYYLIDPLVNPNINTQANNDLIMVKIYLIKDFYDKCYKKLLYAKRVIHTLHSILYFFKQHITNNPQYVQTYDDNYPILRPINDYIDEVVTMLKFCNKGLQKTTQESFYNYPKFVDMVKEYEKKRLYKFYDDMFPRMNFDQYNYAIKKLPAGWLALKHDVTGSMYYVNTATGSSYWNRPMIPDGWKEIIDTDSGEPYYINIDTKEKSLVLPGIGTAYPDAMYFDDKTEVINKVPAPGFRKQRRYIYKYDERDNIDRVKARIKTHKRKTDVKAHLLSSARKREQTIKNRKAKGYEDMASLYNTPLRKGVLDKAAKIRTDLKNEKYHVSA